MAVDLSDIAPKIVRYVPLNAWFRFRRAVEDTPTILMVVEQEANAKTCASLVLRLKAQPKQASTPLLYFLPMLQGGIRTCCLKRSASTG